MKINLLLIGFITICTSTTLNAQVHLGAKGGANISKLNGISYSDSYELGYHLGGVIGYDFNKIVGIQSEVLFNQTNTKVEDGTGAIFENALWGRKKLNYLTVPVLIKLLPNSIVSFHAGPQFSILTNRNKTVLENGQQLFRSSDFGIVAGAELNLGPIGIYGRYIWGFKDINDVGTKARSQQIQAGLNVKLF